MYCLYMVALPVMCKKQVCNFVDDLCANKKSASNL